MGHELIWCLPSMDDSDSHAPVPDCHNQSHSSRAEWAVVTSGSEAILPVLDSLLIAWAKDQETGEPRYIGELTRAQTGNACKCECYSCGLPLQAVNAGKVKYDRRPHFRHPNGAPKDSCLVLAARVAALEMLRKDGVLHLPRRRVSAKLAGLSGMYHEAWVEAPEETVRVSDFSFRDRVAAKLILDDGREIRVVLDGGVSVTDVPGEDIALTPTIRLSINDPKIAGLSPEQLRKRLTILVEGSTWCSHWEDEALHRAAMALAQEQAEQALDWLPSEELSEGLSKEEQWETLLHLKAKEVLDIERKIMLPTLTTTLQEIGPTGAQITASRHVFSEMVALDRVVLEKPMGAIRPDVHAYTRGGQRFPAGDLMIEITVTNTITDERLARLKAMNLPVIEIDISRMGGRVTLREFTNLVVNETAGKRWLWHPLMEFLERDARAELDQKQANQQVELERIARFNANAKHQREAHAEDCRKRFLSAIHAYCGEFVRGDANQQDLERALSVAKRTAEEIVALGYPEAEDDYLLYRKQGSIIQRLLSIKENRPIGYNFQTTWQVLNAILQESQPYLSYQSLYLIAIRIYRPTLTKEQNERVEKWRNNFWRSLKAGENTYLRDKRYDRLLSFLFPEMASGIAIPLQKTNEKAPEVTRQEAKTRTFFRSSQYEPSGFLTGPAYDRWKADHPEAAAEWEARFRK